MLARTGRLAAQSVRRFGSAAHGHGHGGPAKTLPPRPPLADNATFGQRIEHAMWDKRHPDYEGIEAYARYYMPENAHLAYFVLGTYAAIGIYFSLRSRSNAAAELRAQPAPARPDYRTVKTRTDIPDFGSDEWVSFINEGEDNVQKWFASLDAAAASPAH